MTATAVILAAGYSSRLGLPNTLTELVQGTPVLRRVVRAVLEATEIRPLVVLGHDADVVIRALRGLPVSTVLSKTPERGQAHSVRLGLIHAAQADATLVVPGDQPFLTGSSLRGLLNAHHDSGGTRITVPMRGPKRGNPVVLPADLRHEIVMSGETMGCGGFTRRNPDLITPYYTNDPAFFLDVDTPADLARARAFDNQAMASRASP